MGHEAHTVTQESVGDWTIEWHHTSAIDWSRFVVFAPGGLVNVGSFASREEAIERIRASGGWG